MKFIQNNTIIYSVANEPPTDHIAAFDLDYTIIQTKSGKKLPINSDDWRLCDGIKDTLIKLHKNDYKIVIFTNQQGISLGRMTVSDFKTKIIAIRNALAIPFDIFISIEDDYYRKPMTGMWDMFISLYTSPIDMDISFYSGDAAGRDSDHSISDLFFANNIGLKFILPETITKLADIKQHIQAQDKIDNNLQNIDNPYDGINVADYVGKYSAQLIRDIKRRKYNILILMGRPGSGKSEFAAKLNDFTYINSELFTTKAKYLKELNMYLNEDKNIIIDGTHPSKESRNTIISIIKTHNNYNNKKIAIIWFNIPEIISKHLNNYRVQITKGQVKKIPNVVYRVYNKKFDEPTINEFTGVDLIIPQWKFESNNIPEFYYKYDI